MLKLTLLVLVFSLSLGKPATGQTQPLTIHEQLLTLFKPNWNGLATAMWTLSPRPSPITQLSSLAASSKMEPPTLSTPVAEWLERSRANQDGTPFEERISNIQVTIDSGQLAHLRADFAIIVNGVTTSSGKDHFMLIKEPDGWKVALLGYTNVPSSR